MASVTPWEIKGDISGTSENKYKTGYIPEPWHYRYHGIKK